MLATKLLLPFPTVASDTFLDAKSPSPSPPSGPSGHTGLSASCSYSDTSCTLWSAGISGALIVTPDPVLSINSALLYAG